MNCDLILQRDNPQVSAAKLRADGPKAIAVGFLSFRANWILDDSNAPFFLQIWALPEYFILKVFGKPVHRHVKKDNVTDYYL